MEFTEFTLDLHCPKCRRFVGKASRDTEGLINYKCANSRCRTKTIFLIFDGKVRLVNQRLLRNTNVFEPLPSEIKLAIIDSLSK